MPDPTYDVVAVSFPIVYTLDGDHDRNGMLYTLRGYLPLLDWARARWEDDDDYLPRLHERRQWIQLVVDGLWRYEQMVPKLAVGPPQDRDLLRELGGDRHEGGEESDPRAQAVRQNFLATVDEIVAALRKLTGGLVEQLSPDPAIRLTWAREWAVALRAVDRAIAEWFQGVEADGDPRRFDADALGTASGLSAERVRRLLLNDHSTDVRGMAERTPPYDRFNPLRPIPLVRPLVLRAGAGQTVRVRFENHIVDRCVGLHLQGDGLGGIGADGVPGKGVRYGDGAAVGRNPDTTVPYEGKLTYLWRCTHEGVWAINDLGDVRGSQQGTNAHGLFGALVVEPEGATWQDPETGELLTGTPHADGPDVDIIMPDDDNEAEPRDAFVDFHLDGQPPSHREFTVFFHDEPEIHSGLHFGEHSVMPLSYRAEPMPNRLPHRMRRLAEATSAQPPVGQVGVDHSAVMVEIDDELGEVFRVARTADGEFLERVSGEEQHHSSWLFGDPVTPIFRAYRGDPARVRLVHAGVKETHVFHLHVHQWRAVPQDTAPPSVWKPGQRRGSQLIDSITIGPQTAVTIDPLYGSGSRQRAVGDIIWHCHLYPHFHHGMWGLWRSFDRMVDGHAAYPDGTPCHRLEPLPGRPPPARTQEQPGFPWFIDAVFPQKSPPPPVLPDADVGGRRRLLGMGPHSARELAAFDKNCVANPQPGALFVDLDGGARKWNKKAELPPPRILSYDIEVRSDRVEYNTRGWHDRNGHHYRITGIQVTQLDDSGHPADVRRYTPPDQAIEPFFPRANHGDVVELRMHNLLGTIPPDGFDLTTPPVECGLHVHLVKFDVLMADGSSTGFNYLSGASTREAVGPDLAGQPARNVSLHRWVVDEEFGPCFFHDHLLANFRQKHGLFAALIAEPHGSQWHRPDQETVAWSSPEAVVVPPSGSGIGPHREACLAVGDFVPLHSAEGRPLNPPGELGADDDPGAMAVNYRCSPLTFRGDDPSEWFSSTGGDPDTPVLRTYPGERLRIRLIQGSHEEQHSFSTHGLRWRRDWHNPVSTLVNQQTVGISEVFTLDVDPAQGSPYGPGDHLWQFAAMDDLWLGCWGLVRALVPGELAFAELAPLPELADPHDGAVTPHQWPQAAPPRPHRLENGTWSQPVRRHVVVARRREHEYEGPGLTDPWGLVYEVADDWDELADVPGRRRRRRKPKNVHDSGEPLVLRARRGEWVHIVLINEVLPGGDDDDEPRAKPCDVGSRDQRFGVEPSPPRLPIESLDKLGHPDKRTVSPRVSLHASLLRYDVVADDGANVGRNNDGTAASLGLEGDDHGAHAQEGHVVFRDGHGLGHDDANWREYWWYADEALAPASHENGPGQICYLQDMADVRNHRHHGLVGALVVEPGDVTPVDPDSLEQRWSGPHALIAGVFRATGDTTPVQPDDDLVANEQVLVLQDGLRHFVAGNPDLPVRDVVPGDDPEDSGQKGISYGSALVNHRVGLRDDDPPTPLWQAEVGQQLWLRLVCAADKPRNHTFTVHGLAWEAAPWVSGGPHIGSLSGLTAGTVHDLVLRAAEAGDHAYRSGVFRWAVEQGMWGILRVEDASSTAASPSASDNPLT